VTSDDKSGCSAQSAAKAGDVGSGPLGILAAVDAFQYLADRGGFTLSPLAGPNYTLQFPLAYNAAGLPKRESPADIESPEWRVAILEVRTRGSWTVWYCALRCQQASIDLYGHREKKNEPVVEDFGRDREKNLAILRRAAGLQPDEGVRLEFQKVR